VFIRFQGAILLAVLTAVAGGALEGSILDHRRGLSRQHYRLEALRDRVAQARLRTERLSTPTALSRPIEEGRFDASPRSVTGNGPRAPLLHWRSTGEVRR
jgi:hypothetical protein